MSRIYTISDINAPELDVYARLSEVQLLNREYPERGLFIAESPLVIERALRAGYEPVSFLVEDRLLETQALPLARLCPEAVIYTAPFEVLTGLTGFKLTRGLLCAMRRKPLPEPMELCEGARRVAVLEDVVNPTNMGAILRSAAALNIDALLLSPFCTDPLYRRSARVSMGTVFQLPWTYMQPGDWPGRTLSALSGMGFVSVAMALKENSISIKDRRLCEAKRLVIVLGTEGEGLAGETIGLCDHTAMIPMSHGVDSLNVAAASAVAFWQLAGEYKER